MYLRNFSPIWNLHQSNTAVTQERRQNAWRTIDLLVVSFVQNVYQTYSVSIVLNEDLHFKSLIRKRNKPDFVADLAQWIT